MTETFSNYATYDDYLDSHVTDLDVDRLGSVSVCRRLLAWGLSRDGVLKEPEFDRIKTDTEVKKNILSEV
jgi:hypothetical protein